MWMLALSTLLAAVIASAPDTVDFPGSVRSAAAPDGSGARIYYTPHLGPDGAQAHPVFFDDGQGRVQRLAPVSRNMSVGWSPDGRHVFLQDNFGSDIADCYALTRLSDGIRGVSLLKRIRRTPGRPKGRERPYQSHYYVSCDRWNAEGRIAGSVSGRTDSNPAHDFNQSFVYEPDTHKVFWRR